EGVQSALVQIAAKGRISAEEILQLQERLPQIRQAMIAAFGTSDTEVLAKRGIGAQEFIRKITAEFAKLPPVAGGARNSLDNFRDALGDVARNAAQTLLPRLESLLEF